MIAPRLLPPPGTAPHDEVPLCGRGGLSVEADLGMGYRWATQVAVRSDSLASFTAFPSALVAQEWLRLHWPFVRHPVANDGARGTRAVLVRGVAVGHCEKARI